MTDQDNYETALNIIQTYHDSATGWQERSNPNNRDDTIDAIDMIKEGFEDKEPEKVKTALDDYEQNLKPRLDEVERSILGPVFRQADYSLEGLEAVA